VSQSNEFCCHTLSVPSQRVFIVVDVISLSTQSGNFSMRHRIATLLLVRKYSRGESLHCADCGVWNMTLRAVMGHRRFKLHDLKLIIPNIGDVKFCLSDKIQLVKESFVFEGRDSVNSTTCYVNMKKGDLQCCADILMHPLPFSNHNCIDRNRVTVKMGRTCIKDGGRTNSTESF